MCVLKARRFGKWMYKRFLKQLRMRMPFTLSPALSISSEHFAFEHYWCANQMARGSKAQSDSFFVLNGISRNISIAYLQPTEILPLRMFEKMSHSLVTIVLPLIGAFVLYNVLYVDGQKFPEPPILCQISYNNSEFRCFKSGE